MTSRSAPSSRGLSSGSACRSSRRARRSGSSPPQVALAHRLVLGGRAAGPPRRRSTVDRPPARAPRSASRSATPTASSSAVASDPGGEAPVLDELVALERRRGGSGCCRRRSRAARRGLSRPVGCPGDGRRPARREALRDPRLAPRDGRAADARAQGHPVQARGPDAGDLAGRAEALRFPSNTVPSLAIDGRKLTGSRAIAQELDGSAPTRRSTRPSPSAGRRRGAERWGEEVLQPAVRRILWNILKRDRAAAGELRGGRQARDSRSGSP